VKGASSCGGARVPGVPIAFELPVTQHVHPAPVESVPRVEVIVIPDLDPVVALLEHRPGISGARPEPKAAPRLRNATQNATRRCRASMKMSPFPLDRNVPSFQRDRSHSLFRPLCCVWRNPSRFPSGARKDGARP
jgi:hypothetical protein